MLSTNIRTFPSLGAHQGIGQAAAERQRVTLLRRMIWLYFVLLIAEGALRKWTIPSLSAPLLIVRDPLVLLIYVQAVRCRRFPISGPMVAYFLLLSSFLLLALFQTDRRNRRRPSGGGLWPANKFLALATDFCNPASLFLCGRSQTWQMDPQALRAHDRFDDLAIPVSAEQLDQCRNHGAGRAADLVLPWGKFDPQAPSVLSLALLTFSSWQRRS